KYLLVSFLDPVLFEKILHKDILKIKKIDNIIILLIVIFFLISLSGPQWGLAPQEVKSKGADIIIGIDVSKSMLVEDVLPNRLEFTKKVIRLLLDRIEGSRVGIITFAGIAFYQCPLTVDISAAKYFLNFIDTDIVPYPGTKIGECLSETLRVFKQYGSSTKILVLFSDGEDHDSSVEYYAEELRKNGVVVFTVGVGTPEGRPIAIRDARGTIIDYKKDKKGNIVTSRLNEKLLSSIAEKTLGKYYALSDNNLFILESLVRELNMVKKGELKSKVFNLYKNRYHYFVYILLFLFFIEIFVPMSWVAKIF
ncbi:MAG: VWA domain-containing protein, partial [Endomicrobiia bacterium]